MTLRGQVFVLLLIGAVGAAAWVALESFGGQQPAAEARGGSRATPVEVAPVTIGPVETALEVVGTTRANEAVTLTPKISGLIRELNFQGGEQVEAGAVVASLDAAEREAELRSAEAELLNARQLLERAQTLRRSNNVAQSSVDEAVAAVAAAEASVATAAARLGDLSILAPFAGTLGIRRVSPGSLVTPGDPIFTLDDVSVIKVDFALPETLLGSLAAGQEVAVASDALPGQSFTGELTDLDTRIDPVTRTVAAVAAVPNPDRLLRPGMFMTVRVIVDRRDAAMLIPEQALVPQGQQQFVYVVADGRAVRRPIGIGTRQAGQVEVLEGLQPGDLVVIRGVQRLRDGAAVTVPETEPPVPPAPAPGA